MENKFFIKNSLYIESPNFDDRPKDIETDTIIIHSISLPEMEYDNDHVSLLFQNKLKPRS